MLSGSSLCNSGSGLRGEPGAMVEKPGDSGLTEPHVMCLGLSLPLRGALRSPTLGPSGPLHLHTALWSLELLFFLQNILWRFEFLSWLPGS